MAKKISIDLKQLHLPGGVHHIRIKACAPGYRDSELSNEVIYIASYSLDWSFSLILNLTGNCQVFCKVNGTPQNQEDYDFCVYPKTYKDIPEVKNDKFTENIQNISLWYNGESIPVAWLNDHEYDIGKNFSSATQILLTSDSQIEIAMNTAK